MNGPPQLRIYPTLVRAAVACVLGVLLIKGVPLALKDMGVARTTVLVWTLGWPFQKQPPSPAYLGVYIGLGLLLLGGSSPPTPAPRSTAGSRSPLRWDARRWLSSSHSTSSTSRSWHCGILATRHFGRCCC